MNASDYNQFIKRMNNKAVAKKCDFFHDLPFLRHWTLSQVRKLVKQFHEEEFKRNQLLFTQGDPAEFITIICEGEFELTRRKNKLVRLGDEDDQSSLLQMLGPQIPGGGTTRATRNMSKEKGKVQATNIKLALASSGQFLGAEDVLNQRNFTTTARCTSTTATVYTLKTDDFFFWVGKNERTMCMMNEMFFKRDSDTKQKIRKAAVIKKMEMTGVTEPPKAKT
jgi:CRP-like cAMP-binding protein